MSLKSLKNQLERLRKMSNSERVQEGDPVATNLKGIGIGKELIGLTYGDAANHIAEKIRSIESDREEYQPPEM